MTLPGWQAGAAHLQILIVFIKKLWENVGQNMTTKEYWIFVFPHNGLHFINQGNGRREKKDLRRRGMTSMKLNSNIPNNQDANTINNVTFFVLGVTVITITGWPGILTLSSGSIKILCGPAWSTCKVKSKRPTFGMCLFDLYILPWNKENLSRTVRPVRPPAELSVKEDQPTNIICSKNTNPG